jgi:uncharacterized membrane protein
LRTPDASLGLTSYGVTLALAGTGSRTRFKDTPLVPLAMAAKVLVDAVRGIYLTAEQETEHRRFCSWCLAATVASVASLPQVVPETKAALRALRRR